MSILLLKTTALEARTHLGELIDRVRYTRVPCLIERHGKGVAVLIEKKRYDELTLPTRYKQWLHEGVAAIIKSHSPEKIILFGSGVRGDYHEGSDIDLLIIKETAERKWQRCASVLNLLEADNPIEPHVYTPSEIKERLDSGDPFIREVLQKGLILYEAKE